MKTKEELELIFTKIIVLMQVQLELMDEFKGSKLYSRDIKFHMKKLEECMEKYLNVPFKSIDEDGENEESFMALMRGVNNIINATMEDIYLASGRTE
jgi:fructose-specific phosphotransferase system component IIB